MPYTLAQFKKLGLYIEESSNAVDVELDGGEVRTVSTDLA